MIGLKKSEAAIRVGADGAEWLAWRLNEETLVSGRMTASYSVEAALDQWLGRAIRFGLKPKRVWLIAGTASCAHRRLVTPGTDPQVVEQALPFAVGEELPLPIDQMWWATNNHIPKGSRNTLSDLVATPKNLFTPWEEALRDRKIELAGRLPEAPLLWQELAAIRGSEIDMLTVWSERRATIVRGTEDSLDSVLAFVRGPGESWEALQPDLARPLATSSEGKMVLSIFTSDRLRKRILSLPDLIPTNSENRLTLEIFHGVPEEVSVAASLLALRRLRIEKRKPEFVFLDQESVRARPDLRKAAKSVQVSYQMAGACALAVVVLALLWASAKVNGERAEAQKQNVGMMQVQSDILGNQIKALQDLKKKRVDWGSVWLELSQKIPESIQFKEFSYGQGSGFRITGTAQNLPNLGVLDSLLKNVEYFQDLRIQKTETADKKVGFQIFADFSGPADVPRYTVQNPNLVVPGTGADTQGPPASEKKSDKPRNPRKKTPKPKPAAKASPTATPEGGKPS